MTQGSRDLIVAALLEPGLSLGFSDPQWDLLIRQGRRSNLLARLAFRLEECGLLEKVPHAPRLHLNSAMQLAHRQDVSLRWEVACVSKELLDANTRITLLKGAAYAMASLPAARGRTFSDIDIIVPRAKLEIVESELLLHGWHGGQHDAYDERYYRQWMHEVPPLSHFRRGTTIDLHHAILPISARIKVNTDALLDAVVALDEYPNMYVLQPVDMLLHSATHLFHEGEFEKGIRDLFDLDSLLRHFGKQPKFWEDLVPRAVLLGLTRPLYYALRYSGRLLGTPAPAHVLVAANVGRPPWPVARIMDMCYEQALRPLHGSTATFANWLARFSLYVRSHWIRMPFHLLVYHLGRKAFIRLKKPEQEESMDLNAEKPG